MKFARSKLGLLLVLGLLAALLPIGSVAPALAAPATGVFLSELHYDNASTDVGEFVEVTGDKGGDLGGWSVVLYNGSGGAPYATINLVGTIPDEDGSQGAVAFSHAGIQNGSPDGLALVDDGGVVLEFLSYEGSFTAVGGPADGMTSVDIGVSESSSTPIGESLQVLSGLWTGPTTESPGLLNGVSGPAPATGVFLSELHYDNASTDVGEFVEVTGDKGGDLGGWSVVLYNGSGGAPYATINLVGTIPDEDGSQGAVAFSHAGIQNGSPDGLALVDDGGVVLEFLSYEGSFTAVGGPADGMTSVDIGVSESSSTPIGESLQVLSGLWTGPADDSPGLLNTGPPATGVSISELHYDNAGGDVGEFVEVTGDKGGDLGGWSVVLYNGNGGAVYDTVALSGLIPDEDGSQGAAAFYPSSIQNGSPDGLALVDDGGAVLEFLSYEGSFTAVGGPADGMTSVDIGVSESSSTPIGESLQVLSGLWTGPADDSPGLLNTEPPPPPTATEEMIHDVQGPGLSSPLEGQRVIVEGVVTSDQQDGDFNGWFMQELDVDHDADPATSEGIRVFEGGNIVEVNVGDIVKVEGTVVEFFGETQITDIVDVMVTGGGSFTAAVMTLPFVDFDQPEWYEGMYVTVPQELTISEYFNFDRYGEIVLTVGRPPTSTAVYDPGSPEQAALALENALGRITLDDNRTSQNPDPAIHPNGAVFDLDNLFRGGDIVENTTGVISYGFGKYRIQPTQGADYTALNPRPASPGDVGGDLAVATFNVLNYFTTIDTGAPICGPDGLQGCRGADSDEEFERQRTKIIAAIAEINADVVGLMEIENFVDGGIDEPITDLVSGINDVLGAGTYAAVETGAIGGDAIKVAFIYKPASVSLNGAFAVLDSSVDPTFNDDKNRPALAQTFTEIDTGESVTVAVNHLKSKGSNCDSLGDPNLGDGAGNCNLTRTSAAVALVNWLAADATGSGEEDVLIIGDLNSYDKEDPIDALIAAGYSDLVFDFGGEYAYSYVFSGEWGYLDYAMANESLRPWITGTTVWHINADEPDILDYNLDFKQPPQQELYESNAYRSSDHDPVIVGLDLPSPKVDKEAVVTDLEALLPTGDRKTDMQINKAIDSIDGSLNDGWWTSDQTITNKKVFDNERSAIVQLELVVAAGGPEAIAAQDAIGVLVNADRQLAQIELIAAIVRDGKASKIADAQMAMAYAADLTMAGLYNEAVNAYKTAWDAATKA